MYVPEKHGLHIRMILSGPFYLDTTLIYQNILSCVILFLSTYIKLNIVIDVVI